MTPPLDFEAAKQKVAEKHKPAVWVKTVCENEPVMSFVKEIAELLAQSYANHYVEKDREAIAEQYPITFTGKLKRSVADRPLPFPDLVK